MFIDEIHNLKEVAQKYLTENKELKEYIVHLIESIKTIDRRLKNVDYVWDKDRYIAQTLAHINLLLKAYHNRND